MAKLQKQVKQLKNDPVKAGIVGLVTLLALIIIGVGIHSYRVQPEHALVNKPYVMTVNLKTTTQGLFTDSTENNTETFYIYLNGKNKQFLSASNQSDLKNLIKDKDSGQDASYSLTNNTLKLKNGSADDLMGNVEITDLHRNGKGYSGTINSSEAGNVKISGYVNFHRE